MLGSLSTKHFTCEKLAGLPGDGPPPYQFRRPGQRSHSEGLVLRVTLEDGGMWVGNFQGDKLGISTLLPIGRDEFCLIADGQGYVVDAIRPAEYRLLPLHPVRDARRIPDSDSLIFANYCDLMVWGRTGTIWKERVVWDWLEIKELSPDHVSGSGWNPMKDEEDQFVLEVKTGKRISGNPPPPAPPRVTRI